MMNIVKVIILTLYKIKNNLLTTKLQDATENITYIVNI